MVVIDWLIAFSAVCGIGMLCYFSRLLQGSWLAPGGIFACVWLLAALLPLLLSPDYPLYPAAYFITFCFVLVAVIGSSIPIRGLHTNDHPFTLARKGRTFLAWAYACTLFLGMWAPPVIYVFVLRRTGISSLLQLTAAVALARYQGGFVFPLPVRLLEMCLYLAALLGGFLLGLYPRRTWKHWMFCLAWLPPAIVTGLLATTRAGTMYDIVLWASALLAGMTYAGTLKFVRILRLAVIGVLMLVMLYAFFVTIQMFRGGTMAGSLVPRMTAYIRVYFTGHMTALGSWYTDNSPTYLTTPGDGWKTFSGIGDLLGHSTREAGLYTDFVPIGDTNTNIYTAWRPLIEDYTIAGALLFVFLFAVVGSYGWVMLRTGRLWGAPLLVLFLAFAMWTPITSLYIYNTILLAILLFAGCIAIISFIPQRAASTDAAS